MVTDSTPFLGIKKDAWITELEKDVEELNIKPELSFTNFGAPFNRREDPPYFEINPYRATDLQNYHDSNLVLCILQADGSYSLLYRDSLSQRRVENEMQNRAKKAIAESNPFEGRPYRIITVFIADKRYQHWLACYYLIALAVLVDPSSTKLNEFVAPEKWNELPYNHTTSYHQEVKLDNPPYGLTVSSHLKTFAFLKRVILLGNRYVNVWQRKTMKELGLRKEYV